MKMSRVFLFLVIGLTAVFIIFGIPNYNNMVVMRENVEKSYAQVQNVLQRQAELIPNLAETVKGYATHEQKTFIDTAAARAKTILATNPKDLANSVDKQREMAAAVAATSAALVNINAIREAHPELKANALFTDLMKSLEGSINRVTIERQKNQAEVSKFNTHVRQFPTVIFATLFGYGPYPYYIAAQESQTAPKIKF